MNNLPIPIPIPIRHVPDEVLAPALVEMLEWRDLPVEGTVAELKARLLAAQASEDDTDDEE